MLHSDMPVLCLVLYPLTWICPYDHVNGEASSFSVEQFTLQHSQSMAASFSVKVIFQAEYSTVSTKIKYTLMSS